MNIYVGNVPYAATEEDLKELFGEYGPVATATIIYDRYDGRSKGFGFVEMENQADGERAMEALDGHEMMGRPLKVNPARPREERRLSPRRGPSNNQTQRTHEPHKSSPNGYFHNPYTFVPTPPREEAIKQGGFAGDFNPLKHPCGKAHNLDHASLKNDLWTGHIPITLKTVTPLVLLKTEGESRPENKPYDVLDYIPESSLRGMLRSAYEVVTNSRYTCFRNDDRLAYRMDTRKALELVPAIIKKESGKLVVHLYSGTSDVTEKGPKDGRGQGPMYAAMLDKHAKYAGGGKPKTRDKVWAEIVLCQHDESPRGEERWYSDYQPSRNYLFWKVVEVWLQNDHPSKPRQTSKTPWLPRRPLTDKRERQSYHGPVDPRKPVRNVVKGYAFITNENMGNKHDERIFFNPYSKKFDLTDCLKDGWRMRIQSYRDAHPNKEDIFERKDRHDKKVKPWVKIGNKPGETAWSPHLYQDGQNKDRWGREAYDALELHEGDMVYARCKFDEKTGDVTGITDIFPVMISRELYEKSPKELLGPSLLPASSRDELSPADRLFGWVLQKGNQDQGTDTDDENKRGYKSRIRVVCESQPRPNIVTDFKNNPLPLAILGQPKPAQGRFYVAKDAEGNPQNDDDIPKSDAGYEDGKGLRGRKHYWHHKGFEEKNAGDYWDPLAKNREYRRTGEIEDSQNRSIKGWIEPGTQFEVSLYVQNLQSAEVGALLWLLTLNKKLKDEDEKYYFKLGYGKPLGFGSVTMEIDKARLKNGHLPLGTGEDWKGYYADLNACSPATLGVDTQYACIQEFQDSMVDAYDPIQSQRPTTPESQAQLIEQRFIKLSFIGGFKQVLKGPNSQYPIHYPRRNSKPNPEGKNYEWFMDNENGRERYEDGKKIALPAVTDKKGLPYNPSKPRQRRGRR